MSLDYIDTKAKIVPNLIPIVYEIVCELLFDKKSC